MKDTIFHFMQVVKYVRILEIKCFIFSVVTFIVSALNGLI
jgi:hypothetical protein